MGNARSGIRDSNKLKHPKNCFSPSRKGAKILFWNQFATLRSCASRSFGIIQKSQHSFHGAF
jgi:hypothetical protein